MQAAARIMLHDWNDGRISYYTLPPKRDDHGHAAAAVVPAYSTDFNVDEVGHVDMLVDILVNAITVICQIGSSFADDEKGLELCRCMLSSRGLWWPLCRL